MSEMKGDSPVMLRRPMVVIGAVIMFATGIAASCGGDGPDQAVDRDAMAVTESAAVAGDSTWLADDEIWLSLADEPRSHLGLARVALDRRERENAAADLETSASLFRLEARRAKDAEVRGKLIASAVELQNLAMDVRGGARTSDIELEEVYARAHLALARHHTSLAARSFERGGLEGAGFHIREAVVDVERGFMLADVDFPDDPHRLDEATLVGERLVEGKRVTKEELQTALDVLNGETRRLDNALGGRRK